MGVSAEAIALDSMHFGTGELYGQSLRIVAGLGRVGCSEIADPAEVQGIEAEAYADYYTGVQENLTTDKEYGEQLKFEPVREYNVVDGKVFDKAGGRMVDIIAGGYRTAISEAEADPRLWSEVERCDGDIFTAEVVETLEEGELYAAISMDPKDAMARDGVKFWESIGYREGMAIIQVYFRKDKNTLIGGAYSVKSSDIASFQKLWAQHGVEVADNEPANQWIRHGLRRRASEEEALAFGPQLHAQYREINGQQANVISVTRLMEEHEHVVRGYFDVYIRSLAKAYHTGQNNEAMRGFASALLATDVSAFDAAARTAMMRIANSAHFTGDDARFMENAVRYSLVEELRKFLNPNSKEEAMPADLFVGAQGADVNAYLHGRAAGNVQVGVAAGRSYGGCSPSRFGSEDEAKAAGDEDDDYGQQGSFGGKGKGEVSQACVYSHTGCYCCKYDALGNELLEPKVVLARRNERGVARCLRIGCKAAIRTIYNSKGEVVGSEVISKGGIYELAQSKRLAAAEKS
jgi:hypothetical protein